jgi:hypothetical protein
VGVFPLFHSRNIVTIHQQEPPRKNDVIIHLFNELFPVSRLQLVTNSVHLPIDSWILPFRIGGFNNLIQRSEEA